MSAPQPKRSFLGYDRPALLAACELLIARSRTSDEIDLSHVTVVVPGSRAKRNLSTAVTLRAASAKSPYSPPTIVTTGRIPEVVIPPCVNEAGALATRLAWAEALEHEPRASLEALVPEPPHAGELRAWLSLADMLIACERELAASLKTFADVAPACESLEGFTANRWQTAARIQARAESILDRRGLRSLHRWRIDHLTRGPEDSPSTRESIAEVVLIGIAELSAAARSALGRLGDRVSCFVHADAAEAAQLDEFGCPVTTAWTERTLDLSEASVHFAQGPSEQAEAALTELASHGDRYAVDQVTIGVVDDTLVPTLERVAEQAAGPGVRFAAGSPVKRTGPWKLLRAIGDHLERNDLTTLRALIRHPDMERRLRHLAAGRGNLGPETWLDVIDAYAEASLHRTLTGEWYTEKQDTSQVLTWVSERVSDIVAPLRDGAQPHTRPAGQWAELMLKVMADVYSTHEVHESTYGDGGVVAACAAIREAADELRLLTTSHADWPAMHAIDALRLVLERAGGEAVPQDPSDDSIELLGWLELPLDPSPCMAVVGMNDGSVPESTGADALLTESLRRALGMPDSRNRYARDAWILKTLRDSREHLLLIAGKRDAKGDPLWPSRLLLAEKPAVLPGRMLRFLGKTPSLRPSRTLRPRTTAGVESLFKAPPSPTPHVVTSMSVTSFKEYLASPYVFYLKYVLNLKERKDPEPDLTHLSFGNLVHDAMKRFSKSDAKDSPDARRIEACLLDELATSAKAMFGPEPSVAVALQIEFARRRLRTIATWQAGRTGAGWRIEHDEWSPPKGTAFLLVDETPMALIGRIDRIERHVDTGQLAILDFKTGGKPVMPSKARTDEGEWVDLQLPLYRHLVKSLGGEGPPQLGYVNINHDATTDPLVIAEWDAQALDEADKAAEAVVRSVRDGAFAEVGDGPRDGSTFASICGLNQFKLEPEDDDSEEDR